MPKTDEYKTISAESEGFFKDKGSKFISHAYPVSSEEECDIIRSKLKKKYHDARHHVYAFRIGADMKTYRSSDDGEPSNSSGPPVMGVIRSFELTDILIVVIRYFGGTKLGIPGLINAYKTAAFEAVKNAKIITQIQSKKLTLEFEYPQMNDVMRVIKDEKLDTEKQIFEITCKIILSVRISDFERIKERFERLYPVKVS